MSNILILNQSYVMVGLGTVTFTIPVTGLYNVQFQTTEVPPSSLVVLVKNNGSTVYTAPTITPTQSALQFKYGQPFTAADVVTVVLSSSAAIDSALNNVKSIVSIGQGL